MERILVIAHGEQEDTGVGEILKNDYELTFAVNAPQAFGMLESDKEPYAAVLLDYDPKNAESVSVLQYMKEREWMKKLPVIILTEEAAGKELEQLLALGVADFVFQPVEPVILRHRVMQAAGMHRYQHLVEQKAKEQITTLKKQYKLLLTKAQKLQANNITLVDIMGTVVEYRNLESSVHIQRVKNLTRVLAEKFAKEYPEYNLGQKQIDKMVSASAVHDLGKIMIPDSVLLKPGKLTEDEFACLKSHAARGAEILSQIKDVWDEEYGRIAYDICRYHHERYDGRGYPDHLKGEDIPIYAQIVSVADVYDELVSESIYKKAMEADKAFHMILSGECGVFSPKILVCLRAVRPEFEKIIKAYQDEEGKAI